MQPSTQNINDRHRILPRTPRCKGINIRRPAAYSLHRFLASPRFSPGCPSAEVSLSLQRFMAMPVADRHFKEIFPLVFHMEGSWRIPYAAGAFTCPLENVPDVCICNSQRARGKIPLTIYMWNFWPKNDTENESFFDMNSCSDAVNKLNGTR